VVQTTIYILLFSEEFCFQNDVSFGTGTLIQSWALPGKEEQLAIGQQAADGEK
jgi:hypothetical protein